MLQPRPDSGRAFSSAGPPPGPGVGRTQPQLQLIYLLCHVSWEKGQELGGLCCDLSVDRSKGRCSRTWVQKKQAALSKEPSPWWILLVGLQEKVWATFESLERTTSTRGWSYHSPPPQCLFQEANLVLPPAGHTHPLKTGHWDTVNPDLMPRPSRRGDNIELQWPGSDLSGGDQPEEDPPVRIDLWTAPHWAGWARQGTSPGSVRDGRLGTGRGMSPGSVRHLCVRPQSPGIALLQCPS